MTPEFDSHNHSNAHSCEDSPAGNLGHPTSPLGGLDTQKRDRFELLSAYLDGEVSATERQQVQEWLATDPKIQCLYQRLLKLRQGLRTLPVPSSEQPVEQTVDRVFARLKRRRQRVMTWGGAIAAVFVAAVSGVLPGDLSFSPQLARSPQPEVGSEPLMIALNKPLVDIPKAAVAAPEKPFQD